MTISLTLAPMDRLYENTLRVSGVDVTVAGRDDDLYFRNATNDGNVFEPAVAAADLLLDDSPVILDVGASIGAVTAALGTLRPEARIVSFEPNPDVHSSLRATVAHLAADVTVVERAVGAAPGQLGFHRDPNGSAWGFLSEELGETIVEVVTIDDVVAELGLGRVDFIKIDVEGGELGVLEGATETLETHRPIVVFEVNVFCLWRYGRTLPQDLFAWIIERYDHLAALHGDGTVTHIHGPDTVNHLLFILGTRGGLLDVVASDEPLTITEADIAGYAHPPAGELEVEHQVGVEPRTRSILRRRRR